ncbi:SPW repeat protein [Mesorhizobium sp. C420B]|uniref:SPW repeat protein n=1 Tax=unclassified Mesorhizobium TaxID=325217 RepID=UPI00040BB15F|nr:SPW repeat protein [Mesorhizobium sp. LSHC420B00]
MKNSALKGFVRAMIALWTLISPWVLVHLSMAPPSQIQISAGALWNFLVVGLIMMVISIAQLMASTIWEGRINAAVGIWLIVSPWVVGFGSDLVLTWNAVAVGILAVLVSELRG